jgi:hypothetical protein
MLTVTAMTACMSVATIAAAAQAPDYVGSTKCRPCHIKEYKTWLETRHAHALENLGKADAKAVAAWSAKMNVTVTGTADKTAGCVACHTTGFRLPGGYPAADAARNASLALVGCEACHGPGGLHATAVKADKQKTIHRGATEQACKTCHTSAASPKFALGEYRATGVHAIAAAIPKRPARR